MKYMRRRKGKERKRKRERIKMDKNENTCEARVGIIGIGKGRYCSESPQSTSS